MQIMSAREVARYIKINDKRVYRLIRETDMPSVRIGGKVAFAKELIDKWILENTEWSGPLFVAGCNDDLVRKAVDRYNASNSGLAYYAPVGSMNGLNTLREGKATMACIRAPEDGEARDGLVDVDRYLEGGTYAVAGLGVRELGIIVQKGNPKRIKSPKDIAAKAATFANRPRGSETRECLDSWLKKDGMDPAGIPGYRMEVGSDFDVGLGVLRGAFDAGLGTRQTADDLGLDHVALCREKIVMVIPNHRAHGAEVKRFLEEFEG